MSEAVRRLRSTRSTIERKCASRSSKGVHTNVSTARSSSDRVDENGLKVEEKSVCGSMEDRMVCGCMEERSECGCMEERSVCGCMEERMVVKRRGWRVSNLARSLLVSLFSFLFLSLFLSSLLTEVR